MSSKNVRLDAIRKLLRKYHTQTLVLTNPADQFFVTGFLFYAGEAVFILHPKGIVGIMRSLYVEPFRRFAPHIDAIACDEDRLGRALAYVQSKKLSRVGFDAAKEAYLAGKRMVQASFTELPSLISSLVMLPRISPSLSIVSTVHLSRISSIS